MIKQSDAWAAEAVAVLRAIAKETPATGFSLRAKNLLARRYGETHATTQKAPTQG